MDKVYLETSFISHLTSRPSRDLIVAGHQQITQQWWDTRRSCFEVCTSQRAIDEADGQREEVAHKPSCVFTGLRLLDANEKVFELAEALVADGPFPDTAAAGAFHVAVTAVHEIDFLLTWNCRHIANGEMARPIATVCRAKGFNVPMICTPDRLMGTERAWHDPIVEEIRAVRRKLAASGKSPFNP